MSKRQKVRFENHLDELFPGGISDEQLVSYYESYQPVGSGPLGPMKVVCALIEELAKIRGIDLPPTKGTGFKNS